MPWVFGERGPGVVGGACPGVAFDHVAVGSVDGGADGVVIADLLLHDVADRRLLLLEGRDFPPCVVELPGEPFLEGPEFGESLVRRQVGHVFECRGGVGGWHPGGVDRYLLTLSLAGRPAMRGWWDDEATARAKFTAWVGSRGGPGVRVVLADEVTGETLDEWPERAVPS